MRRQNHVFSMNNTASPTIFGESLYPINRTFEVTCEMLIEYEVKWLKFE